MHKNHITHQKIRKYNLFFIFVLIIKIFVSGVFSSDYQNVLFIPFVNHFVTSLDNPWAWVYLNHDIVKLEFPYHPLMLYTLSPAIFVINHLGLMNVFLVNLFFKLPILFADLLIFHTLVKITRSPIKSFYYYFCSPIVIYASYMHSQLDIIPVAVMFYAFYLLKSKKILLAASCYALACCFKMNAVLLLPIFIIYLYKHYSIFKAIQSLAVIFSIYLVVSIPYIFDEGYRFLVLFNDKQNLFFNLGITMGNIMVYIPLLCLLFVYLKFLSYQKVNFNLLDAFCCMTNSIFLLMIQPQSPAWFVWIIPFLCLFIINFSEEKKHMYIYYSVLNLVYISFFLFFHVGDYGDLTFLTHRINMKIDNHFLSNCLFTLLEAQLIAIIYFIYNLAIRNNDIYNKKQAVLIGISGDSGSGKTTLLKDLMDILKDELLVLEGDGAHKWQRGSYHWTKFTHLDPKANYLYQQADKLYNLKHMHSINYRNYNHDTGRFNIIRNLVPKKFIVIAGLHVFYLPKMRKLIDIKIYINTADDLRLYWKIKRDTTERCYTIQEVKKQFSNRRKDADKYIRPQKQFADMIITYFTEDDIENNASDPHIKLRIDVDSNLDLSDLLEYLEENHFPYTWDYSDDLKTQYLVLDKDFSKSNLDNLVYQIANYDEITSYNLGLKAGFRGIIQVIILKMLSEKLREKDV